MKREFHDFKDRIYFITGDVRNYNRLLEATLTVDTIFHLVALKHDPVCEENPWETMSNLFVKTKICIFKITNTFCVE